MITLIRAKLKGTKLGMKKYSRGRRGGPAKALGRVSGARVQIPPSSPVICRCSSMVERDLAKVDTRVQFPSSAPSIETRISKEVLFLRLSPILGRF